jgi:flagella basal body P-ring formation protein FlgA
MTRGFDRFRRSAASALMAAGLFASGAASAGQPVTLKAETLDSDGIVTFGDLFDGAGAAGKIAVAAKPGTSVMLDAAAVQTAARRAGLDWANAEGFRRIIVRSGASTSEAGVPARGNVDVLTYARSLSAGDIVQPQDLVWAKAAAAPADAPGDADAVIGLAAKRPLRAGGAVSARDVSAPMVIKAGEVVTVTYQDAGISLSMQGKAMAQAAVGETFNVQNPNSKKVLQAVATGPGQAMVGPGADRFKSQRQSQYALR